MDQDSISHARKLILEAFGYSISAHNVQPFRIRWANETGFELWAETARFLPAADPQQKDLLKSAGATFEALRLHLGVNGFGLKVDASTPANQIKSDGNGNALVAKFTFSDRTELSFEDKSLSAQLAKRFSYRGFFEKIAIPHLPVAKELGSLQLSFMTENKKKALLGDLYDTVNIKFLNLPGYASELSSWLRLSKRHAKWSADGLNAESMSLTPFDAFGASFIFKPFIFKLVTALGLGKLLMSEKSKITSAAALVALTGPEKQPFEIGREFLRGWLALTEMNLYGAPLSLLTDDPAATQLVKTAFGLSTETTVYNVLRVGPLPQKYSRPSPARRPQRELVFQETK